MTDANNTSVNKGTKAIYSVKRLQPYRGGHFVPRTDNFATPTPVPTPNPYLNGNPYAYGYTEQTIPTTTPPTAAANALEGNYLGKVTGTNTLMQITGPIFHSLDRPGTGNDNWDLFPFHDRDFQSLAELFLVPACPPGLFTKQFVELPDVTAFNPSGAPLGDMPPPSADPSLNPTPPNTPYYYPPVFSGATPPNSATYSSAPMTNWGNTVRGVQTMPDPASFPYLAEAFFYSSGPRSNWYKVLEFLEIPSNNLGYIGPVAAGQNADWSRRDLRPGQINLNLIADEEVLFGLIDDLRLNLANIVGPGTSNFPGSPSYVNTQPAGATGAPQIATAVYATGSPSYTTTIQSPGFSNGLGVGMKVAFSDFLKLRDGGSGVVYSPFAASSQIWGASANPIALPAKPFRSLASADINDTVLRPARLAAFQALNHPVGALGVTDPGYPDMGIYPVSVPVGSPYGSRPRWLTPGTAPRRLFQIPDADPNSIFNSNYRQDLASERNTGSYVLSPTPTTTPPPPPNDHVFLSDPNASLFYSTNNGQPVPSRGFLGGSTVVAGGGGGGGGTADHRWHPAYRTEMLSKVMNNSTVRTHQYAVWLTVGFFEVVREGNPQMADVRDPVTNVSLAVDLLGPEINAAVGTNVRYRSYFLIDRTKATGFNPADPGDYRNLITFRRRIE